MTLLFNLPVINVIAIRHFHVFTFDVSRPHSLLKLLTGLDNAALIV